MKLIGISGLAGSGKDTVADILVKDYGFVKISLSDELKRICKSVYDFTDEQLWGSSEKRSEPDQRYPRKCSMFENQNGRVVPCELCSGTGVVYLTARHALQTLGTEWGRDLCFPKTWTEFLFRQVRQLEENPHLTYNQKKGLIGKTNPFTDPVKGVVVPDLRFKNEINEFVAYPGTSLIRITRPGSGLQGAAGLHISEQQMSEIPNSAFSCVLDNSGSLDDLKAKVYTLLTESYGD